jgi:hypothetical protein
MVQYGHSTKHFGPPRCLVKFVISGANAVDISRACWGPHAVSTRRTEGRSETVKGSI